MGAMKNEIARMIEAVERGERCELCGGSGVVRFGGGKSAPCIVCEWASVSGPIPASGAVREPRRRRFRGRIALQLVAVAVVAIVLGILAATAMASAGQSGALPACPTEDSRNCFWDAGAHGNGEGRSFVEVEGRIQYVDDSEWVAS